MKYNKIVLLFDTPALKTAIPTYSLKEILDLGFELIVLDASPVLLPIANKIVTAERLKHEKIKTIICNTYKELESNINIYSKNACFIPMFNCYYGVRKVYYLFSKYDVFYGHITTASTELELGDIGQIKFNIKDSLLNPYHLWKAFYNRIGRKIIRNKKAAFIVLGGRKNAEQYIKSTLNDKNTKKIWLHTWDYEQFLNSDKYNNNGIAYCVYLDQYFPFHPDIATNIGVEVSESDKKKFVDDMNNVFNFIRKKYNIDIIIAAHPRADYTNKQNLYPNIKIEYGKTAQLVKGAKLVIANFSNSIMFAIMADLPILIVNSDVIQKFDIFEKTLQGFVNLTGSHIINNTVEEIEEGIFTINTDKYLSIKDNYIISSPVSEKKMWQVILDII